ncbi:putative serine esterase-domain-containing protein [Geopyxis carbonaria]|nr:putative serine esterase-domain-containing protein [Geopyxis carbonaria]
MKAPQIDKNPGPPESDHLCVLVHGLWGNPSHWNSLIDTVESRHGPTGLHILACKSNAGQYTYDGIETGGERVAREIEEALEEYGREGVEIKKISIIGYSLGGLISRYAIGLLYSKGYFQRIRPVNYTSFATPHLGVRTPLLGWHNHVWNVLGARTLSVSGRQLFLIDKFRGTDRPLLDVLADKNSVFFKGLMMFENKALYANVVNDPSTCFYTAGISHYDPFEDLSKVNVEYIKNYAPVVIDMDAPTSPKSLKNEKIPITHHIGQTTEDVIKLPIALIYCVIYPIGVIVFLMNALFQTVLSHKRIRSHLDCGYSYQPCFLEEAQEAADSIIGGIHRGFSTQHLPRDTEESRTPVSEEEEPLLTDTMIGIDNQMDAPSRTVSSDSVDGTQGTHDSDDGKVLETRTDFPTLALHPTQFKMIHHLNTLGWKKFPVWIHDEKHSHAAIIMRKPPASWGKKSEEGQVVINHWLEEVFKL